LAELHSNVGEESDLEEQRIGLMYWNLFKRRMLRLWDGLFPRGFLRSPALPMGVVIALIAVPGIGYLLHQHAQLHRLRNEIQGDSQSQTPAGPRPGGVDPIILTRLKTAGSTVPEFRSATLLPGLGMSLLQITVELPKRGVVSLLEAPTVEEMADGINSPKVGQNDSRGAFEVPWGGTLGGLLSPVGTMRAAWKGHMLEAPAEVLQHSEAVGGLLGLESADSAQALASGAQTDNAQATATFGGSDFDGHWVSKTDVKVNVAMGAKTMLLTVTAKNVGDQPEPMGIGWHPRFLIVSGHRDEVEVRVPGGDQLEISDTTKGLPSGRLIAPGAKIAHFQGRPAELGAEGIDANVVNLKLQAQEGGVSEELRDAGADFGVRLTALSPSIQAMRVTSPSGSNYVSMGAQTNYDDPLGKEWDAADKAPIVILQPGQSMVWKVKLEIFPLGKK
jgi:aldose 1-epimerase